MNEQSNDVSTSQLDNSDSIHDAVAGLQALQQVPNDAPDVPYDAPVESVSRGSTEMAVSAVATAIPAYALSSFIPDSEATQVKRRNRLLHGYSVCQR